jgi:hypothetical protein
MKSVLGSITVVFVAFLFASCHFQRTETLQSIQGEARPLEIGKVPADLIPVEPEVHVEEEALAPVEMLPLTPSGST